MPGESFSAAEDAGQGVGLTELDFEPVPESELSAAVPRMSHNGREAVESASAAAVVGAAAAAVTAAEVDSTNGADEAVAAEETKEGLQVDVPPTELGVVGSKSPGRIASTGAATDLQQIVSPATGSQGQSSPKAPDEKLNKFVDFLAGDNPGACMFHAQMRLSLEGCRKLANFVGSSARVKALSLSHNHIGDDGLKILCEGLRVNRSVTALDLPDNNIGDEGAINLSVAIADNPSLTQLQLAYNRIGDEGAKALAEVRYSC